MLSHELYAPNEQETALQQHRAAAGNYVAYDFHRPEVFGKKVKEHGGQNKEGQLSVFRLEEIRDHDSNQYTPSTLLNIFDAKHALAWEGLPIAEVITQGYLQ